MPNVKIAAPCHWKGRRFEAKDVISVPDETAAANAGWMTPTDEAVTPADSRPTAEEYARSAVKAAPKNKESK